MYELKRDCLRLSLIIGLDNDRLFLSVVFLFILYSSKCI